MSTAVATTAIAVARNACRSKGDGRSSVLATNATVTRTMYALVTAARRLPALSRRKSRPRLAIPMSAASGTERPDRSGATISSAAHGSPTRLGWAHSMNTISARARRHHEPREGTPPAGKPRTLGRVPLDIRNQRQLAGPLDGGGQLPLVARAHAGQPAGKNLAALGEKASQRPVILVIEHAGAGLAHGTGLRRTSHASSSSSSSSSGPTGAATTGLGCSRAACTTR